MSDSRNWRPSLDPPDAAPDLFEPILGWRLWRPSGPLLVSIGKGRRTWNEIEHAVCRLWPVGLEPPGYYHAAPAPGCECGIYAFHSAGQAVTQGSSYARSDPLGPMYVLGAVELWGAVEVYAAGVRAEHARIVGLALPGVGGVPGTFATVRRAASHYGVPAMALPALVEYASAGRGGVPARLMPEKEPPPPAPVMSSPAWPFVSGFGALTCLVGALDAGDPIFAAVYAVSAALWCGAGALQVAARRRLR